MNIYIIEGKEKVGKTQFSTLLANKLSQNNKTLLIGVNRSKNSNIEDYYNKDGMITYDLCDYFLDYVDLKTIINEADNKLDFIISPFVENKYEIKKEDIENILANIDYDNVIFDGIDSKLLDQKTRIKIISEHEIKEYFDCDYFFINKVKSNFDQRIFKENITSKSGKYLGFVNENGSFNNVLDNLLSQKEASIPNIGFFEKIKMKFRS